MSDSHKCGSSKHQLPSSPSCQCHALLSYKVRPQPVYRPEAPEESLKELVDDIFRMGTAYLIRSGERIPPAEMAYFECLNEMGVSDCVAPPQLETGQLFGPMTGVQSGCARTKASRAWTSLEDVISLDTIYEVEKQLQKGELGSAEPRKPESNPDTELASPTVEKDDAPPTAKKDTCDTVQKPSGPVARYITQDQLGTMGWKDLFMLARTRKVVHGPMMSRQELVRRFVEKFGAKIPVYKNDGLGTSFPSKHSSEFLHFATKSGW